MAGALVSSGRQLGAVVRSARERAKLSQAALAQQAGLERQWVVRLETGRLDNPTLVNVFKVLAALDLHMQVAEDVGGGEYGVSLDDLVGGS